MWVENGNIYFSLADQEINSCWSDLCPAWFSFSSECSSAQHVCQNNSSKAVWGKKGTPPPDMAIFLSKTRRVYLNGTKQFCLGKVKRKAIPSVVQLTRVTNELTVQRPLLIGGTFLFLVIGLPMKASSYLRRHWWKSSGWWRSLGGALRRLLLLRATPLCAGLMESLSHYRVQQTRVMTLGLQLQTSPKLFPPSKPLSEKTF